jgi:tetratricopeptide (TPR) repeat protein
VGQNVDPDIAVSPGLADASAIVGLVAIAALLGAAWWMRRRARLAAFGMLTFALLLAPTSSFVPILDVFAERRAYLPMIGFCLVALELLRRWRVPALACVAVLALFGYATFARSAVWSSETALWRDAVAGSPEKYRPRFQLAYAEAVDGKCAEASNEYARAEKLIHMPTMPDVTLYVDWALALDCEGKANEAAEKLAQASRIEDSAAVRSSAGMMQAKLGNLASALEELERAQALDPSFAMTYVYRGNVYVLQGKPEAAQVEFRRALALDPNNAAALQGLAAAR